VQVHLIRWNKNSRILFSEWAWGRIVNRIDLMCICICISVSVCAHPVRLWPKTLQACGARSSATGAGAFYSTREVLPACAARYATQSPPCHLQVVHLSFGFSCFMIEHQRHMHWHTLRMSRKAH